MDRDARRAANREKNARRRQARRNRTHHGEVGRELRQAFGGAFGKATPRTYNRCAEGTSAVPRPETE